MELVILRMVQAIGGALLMANSAAIITDAFPAEELGLALGMNMIAGIFGSFLGILVGGLLSKVGWRWVFLANVPIGVFGTVWAYLKLKEIGIRIKAKHRLARQPHLRRRAWPWSSPGSLTASSPTATRSPAGPDPFVLEMIFGGLALLLLAFAYVETKVAEPMFRLSLFRIRAFTAGNAANFLGGVGRGGMQFMLMIWFQGIWLPQHGFSFTRTPAVGRDLHAPLHGRLRGRWAPFPAGSRTATAPGRSPRAGCSSPRPCTAS